MGSKKALSGFWQQLRCQAKSKNINTMICMVWTILLFFHEAFCNISYRLGGITHFGVFSDAFLGLMMWDTFACATAKKLNFFLFSIEVLFGDNTLTYFIGYKTHNKINQLKGDQIGVIPRCRACFRMVIAQYCLHPRYI
jgi:hypothetical protein